MCRSTTPISTFIPAAQARSGRPSRLYRLVEAELAPRAADPATALMQALWEAFPDRLAKVRPGSGDRATMVGGRGLRLDGGSRVRQEPFVLAIDVSDGGGEASVRQASAIDMAWLDQEPLRSTNLKAANMRSVEELLFTPARRQVEARLRTYWCDLVLDETPIPIRDTAAAAAVLAREAALEADRAIPAGDSAAGRFLGRVGWLAATMPELALPTLDRAAIIGLLPAVCHGLRSLDDVARADWPTPIQAAVGYDRLAEIDRLAAVRTRTGQRQAASDRLSARLATDGERTDSGTLRRPRHAPCGRGPRASAPAAPGPRPSPPAAHERPGQLLAEHLSGREKRTPPPLSQTRLAGRPPGRKGDTLRPLTRGVRVMPMGANGSCGLCVPCRECAKYGLCLARGSRPAAGARATAAPMPTFVRFAFFHSPPEGFSMIRFALLIAVVVTTFLVGTASAAQQSRAGRAVQGQRKGPVAKLVELERRKNEWLRETFLNR